jgi:hypothetical protein
MSENMLTGSFRFWLIEGEARLTELDQSVVLTLPHCDLLLSRDEPT